MNWQLRKRRPGELTTEATLYQGRGPSTLYGLDYVAPNQPEVEVKAVGMVEDLFYFSFTLLIFLPKCFIMNAYAAFIRKLIHVTVQRSERTDNGYLSHMNSVLLRRDIFFKLISLVN